MSLFLYAEMRNSGRSPVNDGIDSDVIVRLSYSGFHTHAVDMGARMLQLQASNRNGTIDVTAPADASVMPPGVYMLWAVQKGVPSEAKWIKLEG